MSEEKDPALQPESAPEDVSKVTDPQVTEAAAESPEKSGEGAPQDDKDQTEGLEITLEGEEPLPPAPKESFAWAKQRKELRANQERIAELEGKLKAYEKPAGDDPGKKPTLEDCGWEEGELEKRLLAWHEKTRRQEETKAQDARRAEEARREAQTKLDAYAKRKEELAKRVPDYAEAEAVVASSLGRDAQGLILNVAGDPALVVCALGQRPKLLEEFAKETDPIRFACKLVKLEANLKTKPKTQAPPPEKPVHGSGAPSGSADSTLERLRAQADKTGDRTLVVEYLRKKRQAER
ncbi:MAG: hypothetical protein WC986_13605 [Elusimicrobiota bacterium]|jgi:hypothetical protein